jgi:hypothetical protein
MITGCGCEVIAIGALTLIDSRRSNLLMATVGEVKGIATRIANSSSVS